MMKSVAPAVFAAGGVADGEEHRRQDRRRYQPCNFCVEVKR